MTDNLLVKLATLWQRKSAKGATYFSGFMGDLQLLLFDGGRRHRHQQSAVRLCR
jgi:hypothetical protein